MTDQVVCLWSIYKLTYGYGVTPRIWSIYSMLGIHMETRSVFLNIYFSWIFCLHFPPQLFSACAFERAEVITRSSCSSNFYVRSKNVRFPFPGSIVRPVATLLMLRQLWRRGSNYSTSVKCRTQRTPWRRQAGWKKVPSAPSLWTKPRVFFLYLFRKTTR